MLSKEEIEEAKECLKETIQNTYAEGKAIKLNNLSEYIDQLETDNTDLQKSVKQIYEDYQDIGKKMFEYSDKLEKIEKSAKVNLKAIREEDTFSGKSIKAFLKSILKTIKGGTKNVK